MFIYSLSELNGKFGHTVKLILRRAQEKMASGAETLRISREIQCISLLKPYKKEIKNYLVYIKTNQIPLNILPILKAQLIIIQLM